MIDLRKFLVRLEKLDKNVEKLNKQHRETLVAIEHISQEIQEIQILINESGVTLSQANPKILTIASCRNNIGATVKLLNPKAGEPDQGTIEKVGRIYVTVRLPNGKSKKRVPKNLTIIEDDESNWP